MKSCIYLFAVICLFFTNCTNKKVEDPLQLVDDSTILQINDSITRLATDFQKNNDTTLLKTALKLSDEVLKLDMTEEGQYYGTLRKSQILSLLGRKKDAFLLQDKITNSDPESLERLIYNGVSSKLKYEQDASEIFFSKAIDQCRKELALHPDRVELNISVATIYIYQGKKEAAVEEIEKALSKYPNNQHLESFKASIDKAYENAQEFLKDKT